MAAKDQRVRFRFGEFEFAQGDGELYRGTERVRLQEQPRQILAVLVEHAGEVVARETLRTRVWTADTFVDFEHGLNTAIKKLRQARPAAALVSSSPASPVRVAIMPLRVLTNAESPELSYLGVGIADAITNRLANVRQIAPRPTWAVLPLKDVSNPAQAIDTLDVRYLLLGTIQPAGGRYRVSVQLVDEAGRAIWARAYDESGAGFLQLQDAIADEIAKALRVELTPPERDRLHVRYTDNPAAYDLYLRGRALLVNHTEANMREAIGYFEQALRMDERYALARAALATADAWFSVRYAYESEAVEWGKRADEQARRALAQDAGLADAHLAIASAAGTLYGGFNWAVVLERSATALAIDDSFDLAHVVRMRAFYHLGRFDDVAREGALARAVNPTPSVEAQRLEVAANLFGGRFDAAARQSEALLAATDAPAIRHYLGLARYYLGDVAGARAMLESAQRGGRPDVRSQASLASIEAATGLKADARARAARIIAGTYMDHHVAYSLGVTFAQLGDHAAAITYLRQAADTGFPCPPWYQTDSLLGPLKNDPAFVQLLARLRRG